MTANPERTSRALNHNDFIIRQGARRPHVTPGRVTVTRRVIRSGMLTIRTAFSGLRRVRKAVLSRATGHVLAAIAFVCRDGSGDFVPADYKIDKARRFVLSTGTGLLSKEDVLDHMDRISADPDFDPTFSQLLDFTKVTEVGFGPEEVRQFAERNIFSSRSRRAFLVQNDLHYGLARMFEIHRELKGETGIAVFRSMEDAMDWIAVGHAAS